MVLARITLALFFFFCLFVQFHCKSKEVQSLNEKCDMHRANLVDSFTLDDVALNQLHFDSQKNHILIPARAERIVTLDSYCMNQKAAAPQAAEPYQALPYNQGDSMQKLLKQVFKKDVSKRQVQTIIWNLTAGRHPRDLPRPQRTLLAEAGIIDQQDVKVLPIEEAMFEFSSWVFDTLVVNTLSNYNATERSILQRRSRFDLREKQKVSASCLYPFVIRVLKTQGYARTTLAVYNSSNQDATVDLAGFYLKPLREDVQPLAVELQRVGKKIAKPAAEENASGEINIPPKKEENKE